MLQLHTKMAAINNPTSLECKAARIGMFFGGMIQVSHPQSFSF